MWQLQSDPLCGLRVNLRAIGYFNAAIENDVSLDNLQQTFVEYCHLNLHQPIKTFVSTGDIGGIDDAMYRDVVCYVQDSGSEFLVVVPNASHLGSDLESVVRSLIELDAVGTKVVCFDEDFPDPLQNAFQTLGVKGVSRTRSKNIKDAMRARALQGQVLGRTVYGYRNGANGTLEIEKHEAAVVELIFRLYTKDALGLRLIVQHLNEREIRTRKGGRWNVVSIRDILRNVSYIGTYTRLGIRRANMHEAIVPPEVFRYAQDQTRERRPLGRIMNPEPFLLSGMLYCSYCGNKMMGVTRRQKWIRKDGHRVRHVYRYYQCQSKNNQNVCGYHTWKTSLLEGTVMTQLRYALSAKDARMSKTGGIDVWWLKENQALRESKQRNAERRFLQATKRSAKGEVSIKVLGEYLKELDASRRSVKNEQRFEEIESTLDNWDSLSIRDRKIFLEQHVSRITVEDDHIEVVV